MFKLSCAHQKTNFNLSTWAFYFKKISQKFSSLILSRIFIFRKPVRENTHLKLKWFVLRKKSNKVGHHGGYYSLSTELKCTDIIMVKTFKIYIHFNFFLPDLEIAT